MARIQLLKRFACFETPFVKSLQHINSSLRLGKPKKVKFRQEKENNKQNDFILQFILKR